MNIVDAIALVTSAHRGLRHARCEALLAVGAHTLSAAPRDPGSVMLRGMQSGDPDTSNSSGAARVVRQCGYIILLINNAGSMRAGDLFSIQVADMARADFETGCAGPSAIYGALVLVLARYDDGAAVNMLPVLSSFSLPVTDSFEEAQAVGVGPHAADTSSGTADDGVLKAPEPAPQAKRLLSERETAVLRRLSLGESNKEAARKLQISPSTVRTHVESIFRKLGCSSRTAATLKGFNLGVI